MTRLTLAALIALMPGLAAAWGKSSYYSYSSDRSASYTSTSSDKTTQSTAEAEAPDAVASGDD